MFKKALAAFFMVLFMGLIVTPSVVVALDSSIDTSIFFSFAEEEENGNSITVLSPFSIADNELNTIFDVKGHKSFNYQCKNYPKPHLNLISPPPENIA